MPPEWCCGRRPVEAFEGRRYVFPLPGLRLSESLASRTLEKIYDRYAPGSDDSGFNKIVVPVELAQYGNDKLISRFQAKRLLARVELFKIVMFDFEGVPTIGPAFADEIFRVFAKEHPNIELLPLHASSEVRRMIERAKSGVTTAEGSLTGGANLVRQARGTLSEINGLILAMHKAAASAPPPQPEPSFIGAVLAAAAPAVWPDRPWKDRQRCRSRAFDSGSSKA
jgi:hypothetical protein